MLRRSTTVVKDLFAKSHGAGSASLTSDGKAASSSPVTPTSQVSAAAPFPQVASPLAAAQTASVTTVAAVAPNKPATPADNKSVSPELRSSWYSRGPDMMFDFDEGIQHEQNKDAAAKAGLRRSNGW